MKLACNISIFLGDYRQWNLPPLVRHKELPHKPPEAPFEGLPIYRTDYTPKCDARRANFKPKSELILPDSSIDEVTNYRADYVPHPLQPRLAKGKTLPFKSCTPFNSMTTVQSDYTPKDFCECFPFTLIRVFEIVIRVSYCCLG